MNVSWKCLSCQQVKPIAPQQHTCRECQQAAAAEVFSRMESRGKDAPPSFLAGCAVEMARTIATLKRWHE